MAFKMKSGKEGPMKKNFPGAFKKDDSKEKTVKLRTGGKVTTSADKSSKTYDRTASINKLIDMGKTREEAIKMLDASKSSRKTGEGK